MKRFSVLVVICVVMVCVVCSAAIGAFRMNAKSFARLCFNASASEVREALKSGADWDEEAWFRAAWYNTDPEVIKLLYNEAKKQGVNVLEWKYGVAAKRTALLIAAAYNKNPAVVKCLIDLGANVHVRDAMGDGPIRCASSGLTIKTKREIEVTRILRQAGATD